MDKSDTVTRVINAVFVLVAIAVAAFLYYNPKSSNVDTTATFAVFTTLVGTVVAAYFGITATRDVSRHAVATVAAANERADRLSAQVAQSARPETAARP